MSHTFPNLKQLVPTFVVGSQEYESKLHEDLYVNQSNLAAEYSEHSERFAWYATCYELSIDKLTRLEAELKRAYAIIDAEKRAEMVMAGQKSTEKMVENCVITDERYVALQNEVFEAQRQTGLLKAARDSMMHRRDMLISLGATYRAEVRADMSLKSAEVRSQIA
ncbi:hypothetical protein HC928_02665 [bacterium]|nr:hypothetical protein [bacterium]